MMRSLIKPILNQQADPESSLKLKSKGKGQSQYEPKLESKKYRRISRKTQLQDLQNLYQDSEEGWVTGDR